MPEIKFDGRRRGLDFRAVCRSITRCICTYSKVNMNMPYIPNHAKCRKHCCAHLATTSTKTTVKNLQHISVHLYRQPELIKECPAHCSIWHGEEVSLRPRHRTYRTRGANLLQNTRQTPLTAIIESTDKAVIHELASLIRTRFTSRQRGRPSSCSVFVK